VDYKWQLWHLKYTYDSHTMSLPFELDSCATRVTHMTPVPCQLYKWQIFSCRHTSPGILFTCNRHNKISLLPYTHVDAGWQVLVTDSNSQCYVGKHINGALQDISFLQQCCWRFKCSGIWCYYHWASCSHYMIIAPSYLHSNNPRFLIGFYIISQETWIFIVLYVLFRQYTYTKLNANSSC